MHGFTSSIARSLFAKTGSYWKAMQEKKNSGFGNKTNQCRRGSFATSKNRGLTPVSHLSISGKVISKDCDLCHDDPFVKEIRI